MYMYSSKPRVFEAFEFMVLFSQQRERREREREGEREREEEERKGEGGSEVKQHTCTCIHQKDSRP